nr:Ig-like domain-containing protein [Paenibacillus sp. SYP-B3998]
MINDCLKLNVTAMDNGSPVANPTITFTSSDPSVVSIDNQGRVIGIQMGQATITAKLMYHSSIVATIQITAVEMLTPTYTISVTGNSTIKVGQTASYVSHIYDNGTEVFDQSVQWSLRNEDHSNSIMGNITASIGNSLTLKAGSSSRYINKYIVLIATLTSDPTITIEKTIQLKSLL